MIEHGLALPLWIAAAGSMLVFLMALVLKPARAAAGIAAATSKGATPPVP